MLCIKHEISSLLPKIINAAPMAIAPCYASVFARGLHAKRLLWAGLQIKFIIMAVVYKLIYLL